MPEWTALATSVGLGAFVGALIAILNGVLPRGRD